MPIHLVLIIPPSFRPRPVGARTLSFALASGGCLQLRELNLAFTDVGDTGVTEIGKEGGREGEREGGSNVA